MDTSSQSVVWMVAIERERAQDDDGLLWSCCKSLRELPFTLYTQIHIFLYGESLNIYVHIICLCRYIFVLSINVVILVGLVYTYSAKWLLLVIMRFGWTNDGWAWQRICQGILYVLRYE